MILACHGIQKSFGEHLIVRDGSFHIEDHEKAALVGPNGAGKSTLLKMIVGESAPDDGNVILTKGKTLGYLAQHQEMQSGNTIYEEVRTAKADIIAMERRIREIEMELKHLSGDALNDRLETYNRLTAAFERENGYSCESEITGVLKGLGFTENDFSATAARCMPPSILLERSSYIFSKAGTTTFHMMTKMISIKMMPTMISDQ